MFYGGSGKRERAKGVALHFNTALNLVEFQIHQKN